MSQNEEFFKKQKVHSELKTKIVERYFPTWARIVGSHAESLTYLDMFSGPGYFEDGKPSTPVRILGAAKNLKSTVLKDKLNIHFFEGDKKLFEKLKEAVNSHPASRVLKNRPIVNHLEISPEVIRQLPINDATFSFVDPFGYKGLSIELLTSLVRDWGSDCLFYLNVAGIRRNVPIDAHQDNLRVIFGDQGLEELQRICNQKTETNQFYDQLCRVLRDSLLKSSNGRRVFVLPFAVESDEKQLITHALVFLTKHPLGFKLMKDIMGDLSPKDVDGIPLYRSKTESNYQIPFDSSKIEYKSLLLQRHAGKRMNIGDLISWSHNQNVLLRETNMKAALLEMEADRTLRVIPAAGKRRVERRMGNPHFVEFV